jgi:hypothetical protein
MIYSQLTGKLYTAEGILIGIGYSGNGEGKNNPAMQDVKDHGPIPCGWYTMANPHNSPQTGPFTIDLIPDPENEMFGRSGFKWHGDNMSSPGNGSDGCICSDPQLRHDAWNGTDHRINVIV